MKIRKYQLKMDGYQDRMYAVDTKTSKYIRECDMKIKTFVEFGELEKLLLDENMKSLLKKIKERR